jgi:hypothetical protein
MNLANDDVRAQLAYKPFRPFWLETIGGSRLYVEKAEWFYEVPGLSTIIISSPNGVTITYWQDLSDTIEIEGPK